MCGLWSFLLSGAQHDRLRLVATIPVVPIRPSARSAASPFARSAIAFVQSVNDTIAAQHTSMCAQCGQEYCAECVGYSGLCDTCREVTKRGEPVDLHGMPWADHEEVERLLPYYRWSHLSNQRYTIYFGEGSMMMAAVIVVDNRDDARTGRLYAPPGCSRTTAGDARPVMELNLAQAQRHLTDCHLCPFECGSARATGTGVCRVDQTSFIASEMLHMGEEEMLRPAHAIFFSGCTARCSFCTAARFAFRPTYGVAGHCGTIGRADCTPPGGRRSLHLFYRRRSCTSYSNYPGNVGRTGRSQACSGRLQQQFLPD